MNSPLLEMERTLRRPMGMLLSLGPVLVVVTRLVSRALSLPLLLMALGRWCPLVTWTGMGGGRAVARSAHKREGGVACCLLVIPPGIGKTEKLKASTASAEPALSGTG